MLRSTFCDYSDVYIVVKGKSTVKISGNANRDKQIQLFLHKLIFIRKLEKGNGAAMFFIAERKLFSRFIKLIRII